MPKSFTDLSQRVKAGWNKETVRVYEAAASEFSAELDERAAIGAQLAAARTARSLTQPALASLTGIQQAEISRIESGVGNPTASTLLRIVDALELKLTLVPAR